MSKQDLYDLHRLRDLEAKVCRYLSELCHGQIGCGDDPIEVLLISHASFRRRALGVEPEVDPAE